MIEKTLNYDRKDQLFIEHRIKQGFVVHCNLLRVIHFCCIILDNDDSLSPTLLLPDMSSRRLQY